MTTTPAPVATPQYTPEQSRALETRTVSVALDAGAGCGKTFVLTERYLSHLDPAWAESLGEAAADIKEVVAITFTDAAAREMRGRIRKKCRDRMAAATGPQRAFWRGLLRSLDGARVSTIHTFCGDLVRRYAVELGLDPALRVLAPSQSGVLLGAAVDRAVRVALSDEDDERREGVVRAVADLGFRDLKQAVRLFATHARRDELAPWRRRTPQECVEQWVKHYREVVAPAVVERLLSQPPMRELCEMLPLATPTKAGFATRIDDLNRAIEALRGPEGSEALARLAPLLGSKHSDGTQVYGVGDWPDKEMKERFTKVLTALREGLKKQKRPAYADHSTRSAELGLTALRLADSAHREYLAAKREAAAIDTDGLLTLAHRLLTRPEFAEPRDRARAAVRVLLVDEFQDTNRLQVEIVRALVGDGATPIDSESDSGGPLGAGKLFFVGDEKQSIYRFLGAEPRVFRDLRGAALPEGRLPLSQNFRSQPSVLGFVNALFAPEFGAGYQPLRPARAQATPGPTIDFLWTAAPPKETGNPDTNVRANREREARGIAAYLRERLDAGARLVADHQTGEPRALRPGDVAILFRTITGVTHYERALRDAGIDYYLVGGHAFYSQQEVFDVANLLRAVASPSDEVALVGALRSPLFGLADESLFWLARRGGVSRALLQGEPPAELSPTQRQRVLAARRVIGELRGAKDRVGAATLLARGIELTGYDATLEAEFLGERKRANLDKLVEQARESDAAGGGLPEYLRLLWEYVSGAPKEPLAATTAADADVVRLMTVHQSKGLEFPLVVLADIDGKPNNTRDTAVFDPRLGPLVTLRAKRGEEVATGIDLHNALESDAERDERLRLFYVACTRAADRLVLSACLSDTSKPNEGSWLKTLARRFDLDTGNVIDIENAVENAVENDARTGEPLARVLDGNADGAPLAPAKEDRRAPLGDVLDEAQALAAARPPKPPAGVASIAPSIDPHGWLSVSRISGRLRRPRRDADPMLEGADDEADTAQPHGGDDAAARALGTLVHAVVERLDASEPGSWNDDAARWSAALAPRHAARGWKELEREACDLVQRFVATDRWRAMTHSPELSREVEFLLAWPPAGTEAPPSASAQITGFLDALYRGDDGRLHVVDYKTNRVTAAGVPKAAAQYDPQMLLYALAVEHSLGESPATLTLAFLRPGVEHTLPWDDTTRRRGVELVNAAIAAARG
ncbi:MAG: UvrD-helicase domain-containing protein [Lacipirellulaceae bacterium]